jgi:hypothetical protein
VVLQCGIEISVSSATSLKPTLVSVERNNISEHRNSPSCSAVAANQPHLKDGWWGSLICHLAKSRLRLANWPAEAALPELEIKNVSDIHRLLDDNTVNSLARCYLNEDGTAPVFIPLTSGTSA